MRVIRVKLPAQVYGYKVLERNFFSVITLLDLASSKDQDE